ncbi:glycosyltransferase [Streptacidiphilus carbonis]|uniref:glycosyltransferase n=1 Tax=Streptacidiphilus carbonis TaxID=105422 RepID=UPI0007C803D9|nr:glycosyltransferase [Streptacidiphilus carbonis]
MASDTPAFTVLIPTFNEQENVPELLLRLVAALLPADRPGDAPAPRLLFVDDGSDDTARLLTEASAVCPLPITVLHRDVPEGGLGGAIVAGLRQVCENGGAWGGDWAVVMDADLQHPPDLVPELVRTGRSERADLVVASRYLDGGSRQGLADRYRVAVSAASTLLAKGVFPLELQGISDPMSGFFALRTAAVDPAELRPLGYKILLELAVRSRPRRVAEVPYRFGERFAGESKSSLREGLRFLRHLTGLRFSTPGGRALAFALIGLSGVLPNLGLLRFLTGTHMHYLPAEVLANQAALAWNFALLEATVFRSRRHRHWASRTARFWALGNADLLLRIPLLALLVSALGMGVLPATALTLAASFAVRFLIAERSIYVPHREAPRSPAAASAPLPVPDLARAE